jgi:hypothetical protein
MHTLAITFLVAALVTVSVIFFIVSRMANRLRQIPPVPPAEQRTSSSLLELPSIIRQHQRLFPQSGPMLAFWLSLEFLLVWLTCMLFSLAMNL